MADTRLAWWVRPLNTALDMARFFRIDPAELSWPALESTARCRSGVSAELDDVFRTEMQFLLDALLLNGNLTALGRISVRQIILRRLITHLRLTHELRQYPEIENVPIRHPLFIVGLPRTGTTLLHLLLSCAPTNRALLLWQLLTPYSPDTSQTEIHNRIRHTQRLLRVTGAVTPGLRAIHDLDVHQPEECYYLLPNTAFLHILSPIPQYIQWLDQRDRRPDYQYFKRQLQALQW